MAIVTQERSYLSLLVVPFVLLFYGSLIYSPLLMLASHGWVIARVLSTHTSARTLSLRWLMSWVTWLGGLFAASRYAVTASLNEYASLPLQDPGGCFIATAACRGHRRLVGARQSRSGFWLSRQLQRLKAFEILMWTLFPRTHFCMRQTYNAIGPVLARRVRSRWMGDLCYFGLKPAEWFATLVLWLLLRRDIRHIHRLYRDEDSTSSMSGGLRGSTK